jgi:hypothetical protein
LKKDLFLEKTTLKGGQPRTVKYTTKPVVSQIAALPSGEKSLGNLRGVGLSEDATSIRDRVGSAQRMLKVAEIQPNSQPKLLGNVAASFHQLGLPGRAQPLGPSREIYAQALNSSASHASVEYSPSGYEYSVFSKLSQRYRSEILKDVLQFWYYSPLNRLLLKFDIDNFIARQPKNHFLTQKEERLLHLRRFLLVEHYNTLRFYTNMAHYRAMQTRIGGTKSFASGVYNQQFAGTFKKIRHLFAITPSSELNLLKYDQPLWNSKVILHGASPSGIVRGSAKNVGGL